MDWFFNKEHRYAAYEVSKQRLREVDTTDSFFMPFRKAYGNYYDKWLILKKDDYVYTVYDQTQLIGFLKLKIEDKVDDFTAIMPPFRILPRLKISSMRTLDSYPGLGSQLMGIILNFALKNGLNEIYGTIPKDLPEKSRTDTFFEKWGFRVWGQKISRGIIETVIYRNLTERPINKDLIGLFPLSSL